MQQKSRMMSTCMVREELPEEATVNVMSPLFTARQSEHSQTRNQTPERPPQVPDSPKLEASKEALSHQPVAARQSEHSQTRNQSHYKPSQASDSPKFKVHSEELTDQPLKSPKAVPDEKSITNEKTEKTPALIPEFDDVRKVEPRQVKSQVGTRRMRSTAGFLQTQVVQESRNAMQQIIQESQGPEILSHKKLTKPSHRDMGNWAARQPISD